MSNVDKPLAVDSFTLLADSHGANVAGLVAGRALRNWGLPMAVVRRVEKDAGRFAAWLVLAATPNTDRAHGALPPYIDVRILRFPTIVVFEILETARRSAVDPEAWPEEFGCLRRACWHDPDRESRATWVSYSIVPEPAVVVAAG